MTTPQLPYPYKAIRLEAPTATYHLMFKYLRGAIKPGTEGYDPTYLLDDSELTAGYVIEMLLYPETVTYPTKGHKIAAAAYIWDDASTDGSHWVGIVVLPRHGVPAGLVRRLTMTKAIASLPAVDRAYFHLCLSMMEGRDVAPIIGGALAKRGRPSDRQLFLEHVRKQLVKGYLRKQLGEVDGLTVQSILKSLGMG